MFIYAFGACKIQKLFLLAESLLKTRRYVAR